MSDKKEYILNKSKDGKTANILIDGDISAWWGVGLKTFAKDIANSGADEVMLQINSGGGSVFEGMAIAAYIKGSPVKISTSIMGLAASIATPIAMAGHTTSISKGSQFMIHNASAFVGGQASDLEKTTELLKKIDSQLIAVYVDTIERNGKLIDGSREKTEAKVKEWQDAETWFTAEEAVEHGFIQKVTQGGEFLNKASAQNIYNSCGKFKNTPATFLNKVKNIATMADEKKALGLFSKFLAFMDSNKEDEVVEDPTPEITDNEKSDIEKKLEEMQAKFDTLKAEKEAAELKALQLEEQAKGAASAGASNTPSKKDQEEKTIDQRLAAYSDEFDALAKMLN